jgi:3-oxoacyl-[acyl-carrier protein] reductase
MDTSLGGTRALVTGGSRGIGYAAVQRLVAEGCDVEFCARNESQIQIAEKELSSASRTVRGSIVDIANQSATLSWAEAAIERLGGLDILVANASAMATGKSEQAWRRNFDVEILSLSTILSAARPELVSSARKRGDAAVVIIGSTSALTAKRFDAYGATKAALVHAMKGLSHELIVDGVRVNMVSPGPVYSSKGIWEELEKSNPEYVKAKTREIPLGRMGKPDEIANIVVFLCSPLSRYIVGCNIVADGGRSRRPGY